MHNSQSQDGDRKRRDLPKQAIDLAMQSRWAEAVKINSRIIDEDPYDLEAYNRLGKALSEQGNIRDAITSFRRALEISPYNAIARKNLDRLIKLEDSDINSILGGGASGHAFIEESGKAMVTNLINLATSKVLIKESAGRSVKLDNDYKTLKVYSHSGQYLGQVEPRLASRLNKLLQGGNRYEAAVTRVTERGLSIIIREIHQDPSQTGMVSFPTRPKSELSTYLPDAPTEYNSTEGGPGKPGTIKDWSNDDTEPGDDDAFSPAVHRIISSVDEETDGIINK